MKKNYIADINDMFDDDQLEAYLTAVFNYYNGKINPSNPTNLFIDWEADELPVMCYYYPNRVVAHPGLLEVNNLFEFKTQIIVGIIHELYHAEQPIDYINDEENDIESQVVFAVGRYLVNHLDELKQFGLFADYQHCMYYYNNHLKLGYKDIPYKKMTYKDHINSFVDLCANDPEFAAEIREMINTRSKIIIAMETPNGGVLSSLVICDNNQFIPIEEYNNYINYIKDECGKDPDRMFAFIVDDNESEVHLIIHFEE